ncbi:hypothetical protein ACH4LK_22555 [Streptomyces lydicus]|uniref:hypothetical protein n=1 Tax=Streptomyces lydicus TaxID=47763 RepID=UPI00378F511F
MSALRAALSAVLRPAPGWRRDRTAAVRAERAARPAECAPLLQACCETWWLTAGRAHSGSCRVPVEEVVGGADPS